MSNCKNFVRKTGKALWQLLYRCAVLVMVVGAAGVLDLGLHWTAEVFHIPFGWLSGAVLAAGAVWWIVDMVRQRRHGK